MPAAGPKKTLVGFGLVPENSLPELRDLALSGFGGILVVNQQFGGAFLGAHPLRESALGSSICQGFVSCNGRSGTTHSVQSPLREFTLLTWRIEHPSGSLVEPASIFR